MRRARAQSAVTTSTTLSVGLSAVGPCCGRCDTGQKAEEKARAPMTLLDQDAFLTRFAKALEESRSSGTVYVTFKRCVDGKKSHAGVDPADYRCLVRAVGAKQKISAMISAKDLKRFMQSYGNILKVSLDSLKRKEKKKPDMSKGKSTRAVIRKGGAS